MMNALAASLYSWFYAKIQLTNTNKDLRLPTDEHTNKLLPTNVIMKI
jgi:hypothetical protein